MISRRKANIYICLTGAMMAVILGLSVVLDKNKSVSYESTNLMFTTLRDNGVLCSDYERLDKWIATESAKCTFEDQTLELTTFNNQEDRDFYNDIAVGIGAVDVVGENWIAGIQDKDLAEQVQEALGGKID